jgi:predicted extracellular nuclease
MLSLMRLPRLRRHDRRPRLGLGLGAALLIAAGSDPGQAVTIPEIQGRSHFSPLVGRAVRSAGIVTAVSSRGTTVQDPDGDGDPVTSDAVLIEPAGGPGLRPGDRITFRGTVAESVPGGPRTANLSLTTILGARVRIQRRGVSLPRPVHLAGAGAPPAAQIISPDELPVNLQDESQARANRFDPQADAIDFWESLEGMRVTVAAPVAVSALLTHNTRSSELFVLAEGGRTVEPGRRTAAGGILLQSGAENRGSQNPERIQIQLDGSLVPGPAPAVAVGDRLADVTGVVRYDFGSFEVAATEPIRVVPRPRPRRDARPVRSPDRLTVVSYNVLNLSAQPEDSLQRLLLGRQIVLDLGDPDILALQEIQDESGELDDGVTDATGTLRALAAAIRAAGGADYRYFDVAPANGRQGGAPGGNIRNAFLYDPARVTLVSSSSLTPALLAEAGVRDTGVFGDSRDPLVGVFQSGGRRLTIVNNHLTSRFGSTPAYGAVQPFVQAGEDARAGQVLALRAYVAWLLAADPAARVVVLGDMNTFEFTDDLAALLPGEPPVLRPLAELVPPAERYSYNYEGNSQALDHAFVTESLLPAAELEYVHLNADFPAVPGSTPSDHDPLVLRLPR